MVVKTCGHCKRGLKLTNFYKNKGSKNGLNSQCKDCCKQKLSKPESKNRRAKYQKQYWIKEKKNCFNAYGGCICKCCGESNVFFLTLDHTLNDGAQERKIKRRTGGMMYLYLRQNNYPDKHRYQVFCYNCQGGKNINNGVCPHKSLDNQKIVR